MSRLYLACLLVGTVIGACSVCPENEPDHIDVPVESGTYRIEASGSLPAITIDLAVHDTATFELTNADGARTRVTYRASAPTWSERYAR